MQPKTVLPRSGGGKLNHLFDVALTMFLHMNERHFMAQCGLFQFFHVTTVNRLAV